MMAVVLVAIAGVAVVSVVYLMGQKAPERYVSDDQSRVVAVFPTEEGIQQLEDSTEFPRTLLVGTYTNNELENVTNYAGKMAIDDATIFAIIGEPMYFTNGTTRVFSFSLYFQGFYVFKHGGAWYLDIYSHENYYVPPADIVALAD